MLLNDPIFMMTEFNQFIRPKTQEKKYPSMKEKGD